jgi:predicted transcriptional regulator
MNLNKALLDTPIKDATSHIFRRPFLSVDATNHMLQIATILAIGPQIYVDGLVVMNSNKRPIGRISSKHIISNILANGYPGWLESTAEQMMDEFAGTVDKKLPLRKAIEVFDKTRFAFVPVLSQEDDDDENLEAPVVVASLSIRDILPLIAKANIDRSIKDISSPLVSVNKNTTIKDAVDLMFKKGIRNISINNNVDGEDDKSLRMVNDRKILEFLLSHVGKELMRKNGMAGLADAYIINHLDMIIAKSVMCNTTASRAAELLMDIHNPFLILEDDDGGDYSIVTPWDIVMKNSESISYTSSR